MARTTTDPKVWPQQVAMTQGEKRALEDAAEQTGLSQSEILRRGLSLFFQAMRTDRAHNVPQKDAHRRAA